MIIHSDSLKMMAKQNMSEELNELYVEASPLIERAINDAFPRMCTSEWFQRVSRRKAVLWNLDLIQKSIIDPFDHYLRRGGKRYRPFVAYLILKAFGKLPENHLRILAISELIHIVSLIADDILDNSPLRRGSPSVNAIYGLPMTMNVIFTMIHYPSILIEEIETELSDTNRLELYKLLEKEIFSSCVGVAADVSWSNNNHKNVTEGQIWQYMINKTCPITFTIPVMLPALMSNASPKARIHLREWAILTGIVYQLVDDVLNIQPMSPDWGKTWAEDLDERKCTLLLFHARQHAIEADRTRLEQLMSQNTLPYDDKLEIIDIIKRSGALDYVASKIQLFVKKADQSLEETGLCPDRLKSLSLFGKMLSVRTL
jgi:geranylgeranyl pyrophosphate synthase